MSRRILVIEDNAMNLALMTYVLEAFGCTVLSAPDGLRGMAVIREARPDLVLCDIQMPLMDGYAVAREMKQDRATAAIPLIAVTASAMLGDRERMIEAGFDGYLSKPIDPATLMNDLAPFLERKSYAAGTARTGAGAFRIPPRDGTQCTPASTAVAPTHTILVVDDEPLNLSLKSSLLEPMGYRVITAAGMAHGLALARQHRPDLIISDVGLHPDAGGFDLIRQLKADPAVQHIPVVFITATHRNPVWEAEGLRLGARRFLYRPLDSDELLGEIQACLPHGGPETS